MKLALGCCVSALLATPCVCTNVVLKPVHSSGPSAALIFIEGAEISCDKYVPLMEKVQNKSGLSLWVGLPAFALNTPEPIRLAADIAATIHDMEALGFNASDSLFYYGGHSLGTVFIQDYVSQNASKSTGQVLTGGFLARKHFVAGPNNTFDYPVPTLTMGGSLDGLARVTRTGAEAFYQQITKAQQPERFPVVVVEGMNHQQWASGAPGGLVKEKDLKAEISDDEAHDTASTIIADFLDQLASLPNSGSVVSSAVSSTETLVQPLVDAYELEGSRHFNAPAQIGGPSEDKCVQGGCPSASGWTPKAQAIIANVDDSDAYVANISNMFVNCKSAPPKEVFHLPSVHNTTRTKEGKVVLTITTYSQGEWEKLDEADTGYTYTSAVELGTKMMSRQCTMIKGEGLWQTNFSVDDYDFCAQANQMAYEWALDNAGPAAKARFLAKGQNYTFSPDIPEIGGPWFLDKLLEFTDNKEAGMAVASPMMRTPIDYWNKTFPFPEPKGVPDPGCFHYCKLLSPARAMEWIYVDSLRLKACTTC